MNLTDPKRGAAPKERCELADCEHQEQTVWECWGRRLCSTHLERWKEDHLKHEVRPSAESTARWIAKKNAATQAQKPAVQEAQP